MDNDLWIKRQLSIQYRKLRLKLDYLGHDIASETSGNQMILDAIRTKKPFMCVRLGAVEARCVDKWMKKEKFTEDNMEQINNAAGVFPRKIDIIKQFCSVYTDALKHTDMLGLWSVVGEKSIMEKFCPNSRLMPIRSIEPYYHERPWSKELEGKRVLVIHPFTESIKNQYAKRELLFNGNEVLPEFKELILIKAVQSNAGGDSNISFNTWFDALQHMEQQIARYEFDIAIIGAGAYGLPLAAYIKSMGKQAILMAGSTQILFGIKGNRWDRHPVISKFYNEYWVRPLDMETPPKADTVEGGSYW